LSNRAIDATIMIQPQSRKKTTNRNRTTTTTKATTTTTPTTTTTSELSRRGVGGQTVSAIASFCTNKQGRFICNKHLLTTNQYVQISRSAAAAAAAMPVGTTTTGRVSTTRFAPSFLLPSQHDIYTVRGYQESTNIQAAIACYRSPSSFARISTPKVSSCQAFRSYSSTSRLSVTPNQCGQCSAAAKQNPVETPERYRTQGGGCINVAEYMHSERIVVQVCRHEGKESASQRV
jgi:hypothetical protein